MSAKSVIIFKIMYFISSFIQEEHFSDKGVKYFVRVIRVLPAASLKSPIQPRGHPCL